jgi:hypothetical protein
MLDVETYGTSLDSWSPKMIAGYHLILASSVGERDGMALELVRKNGQRVAEVFQDDEHGTRTFTVFEEQAVPVSVVELFLSEARTRL